MPVYDYEVLEHTADVGLEARASKLTEVFEAAAAGMADIAGAWHPGRGERVAIEIPPGDLGGVLVEFLGEVLWAQDSRGMAVGSVAVSDASAEGVRAFVELVLLHDDDEGTQIKAVTYHQLAIEKVDDSWRARVFFDV